MWHQVALGTSYWVLDTLYIRTYAHSMHAVHSVRTVHTVHTVLTVHTVHTLHTVYIIYTVHIVHIVHTVQYILYTLYILHHFETYRTVAYRTYLVCGRGPGWGQGGQWQENSVGTGLDSQGEAGEWGGKGLGQT